jgi:endonuclease/exonuclease/phosphatase (EEP) superfamily protein YafD
MRLGGEIRGGLSALSLVAVAVLAIISLEINLPGAELLSSLRFHLGVVFLALPVLLFMSRAPWRGVLMLLVVGASLGQGASMVWSQQEARAALVGRRVVASLEVMSFNVLADNPRPEAVVAQILERKPDVALIMESSGIAAHLPALDAQYPYRMGCGEDEPCDIMLMSRTPLEGARIYPLDPLFRQRVVIGAVTVGGEAVTIVGVHLSKPYFDGTAWLELWDIGKRLREAPGRVVLAGDFNAAAWSNWMAAFVRNNKLVPAPNYPATWPIRLGALGVPIDNMFTRGDAVIRSIAALPEAYGSNHRGLEAVVDLVGE